MSLDRPYLRISQPWPPPSVSPAMPVVEIAPPVTASLNAWVSRSNSPQRSPACARAVRPAGSTHRPFIGERSITSPPSHTAVPATLWPPARTATLRVAGTDELPAEVLRQIGEGRIVEGGGVATLSLES